MIKTKNAGILEAREVLRTLNLSNPLRRMYEMHLKAVRDRKAEDEYIRDLGKAEGRIEGKIDLVCRKLAKGKTSEAIAEDLEEDLSEVQRICDAAAKHAPDYDIEKILQEYLAGALSGVR